MDTPDVIGVYSDAYDGGLGDCATIVDTHVRCAWPTCPDGQESGSITAPPCVRIAALCPPPRLLITLYLLPGCSPTGCSAATAASPLSATRSLRRCAALLETSPPGEGHAIPPRPSLRPAAEPDSAPPPRIPQLPPALKKQQTAATAAVGAAALLQIRENAELFRSMLAVAEVRRRASRLVCCVPGRGMAESRRLSLPRAVQEGERDEEARAEFLASSALCESIDDMLKAMPQPKE